MFKLKNVVVFLVILLLVVGITLQVGATDSTISLDNLITTSNSTNDTNTTNTTNTVDTNTTNTTNTTSNTVTSIVQPTNSTNNTDSSSNNDLPQTGVTEDITVMFFIVICAISAIYAYRKIRDYRA